MQFDWGAGPKIAGQATLLFVGSRCALHGSRCHQLVEVDADGSETVRVSSAKRGSRTIAEPVRLTFG